MTFSVSCFTQKSVVVPSMASSSDSTRSGQSSAVMSQKRHSYALGTRLAGLSAASLRINVPRFRMNWSSTASAGMRTVWSSYVACPLSLRVR